MCITHGFFNDLEDSDSRYDGHATVIFGYVYIGDDYRFLVRDPSPIYNGSSYIISYEKLFNKHNPQKFEWSDMGIWEGTVFINTNYSGATVPYYFDL